MLSMGSLVVFGFVIQPSEVGRFYFGTQEDLKCLPEVKEFKIVTSRELGTKETVCLAAKVRTDSVLLPWRIKVDDYVLAIKGTGKYFDVTREQIRAYQSLGSLPKELPTYKLSLFELGFGHLLWVALGAMVIYGTVVSIHGRFNADHGLSQVEKGDQSDNDNPADTENKE